MGVDNRLTVEQLAALAPGNSVTIESTAEFSRPLHTIGTVVRADGPFISVRVRSRRGVAYLEQYRRRDGSCVGGRGQAESVTADLSEPVLPQKDQRARRLDSLFRDWRRNRHDVDRLRALHEAIGERLEDLTETASR